MAIPVAAQALDLRAIAREREAAAAPAGVAAGGRPKLATENLSLSYDGGATHALQQVSLDIPERQITAVIGPSGCGKSSFLKTLNRMVELIEGVRVEGRVLLDGADVYARGADEIALRRRVGMVFQRPNPFPKSVFENVAFGPRVQGVTSRRVLGEIVEESLRRAALWSEVKDRLGQPALALSGGQQQRLCIARALAVEPEVLLMDEPCSALDPAATAKIEDLMVELKRDLTIVIVTHNMQQAARVADRTAFFLNGRLIEVGPTTEFFTRPKDQRTEDYITGRYG